MSHPIQFASLASDDELFEVPVIGADMKEQYSQRYIAEIIGVRLEELFELILVTHTGLTATEFEKEANLFYGKAKDPKSGKSIAEMVYKPQVELLHYLRDHCFKT